jgi:hypothetical protein
MRMVGKAARIRLRFATTRRAEWRALPQWVVNALEEFGADCNASVEAA